MKIRFVLMFCLSFAALLNNTAFAAFSVPATLLPFLGKLQMTEPGFFGGEGICSASVIMRSPGPGAEPERVLATARHCFADLSARAQLTFKALSGASCTLPASWASHVIILDPIEFAFQIDKVIDDNIVGIKLGAGDCPYIVNSIIRTPTRDLGDIRHEGLFQWGTMTGWDRMSEASAEQYFQVFPPFKGESSFSYTARIKSLRALMVVGAITKLESGDSGGPVLRFERGNWELAAVSFATHYKSSLYKFFNMGGADAYLIYH